MADREEAVPGALVSDTWEEAFRQSLAVARSPHAEADQAFVDAISEFDIGWGTVVPPVAK